MRVLVAPDKFKGTLTAAEAATAIAAGLSAPNLEVHALPIADGGEGTAAVLAQAVEGRWHPHTVLGPLGAPTPAGLYRSADGRLAVFEMSTASGLALLPDPDRRATVSVLLTIPEDLGHEWRVAERHTRIALDT